MRKLAILFLLSILLVGCSQQLSKEEAEKIAIETAVVECYSNPELFTKYDTETSKRYHYSVQNNKDVEVWQVTFLTSEREYVEGMLCI